MTMKLILYGHIKFQGDGVPLTFNCEPSFQDLKQSHHQAKSVKDR